MDESSERTDFDSPGMNHTTGWFAGCPPPICAAPASD